METGHENWFLPWGKEGKGELKIDTRELRGVWASPEGAKGEIRFTVKTSGVEVLDTDGALPVELILALEREGISLGENYCDQW